MLKNQFFVPHKCGGISAYQRTLLFPQMVINGTNKTVISITDIVKRITNNGTSTYSYTKESGITLDTVYDSIPIPTYSYQKKIYEVVVVYDNYGLYTLPFGTLDADIYIWGAGGVNIDGGTGGYGGYAACKKKAGFIWKIQVGGISGLGTCSQASLLYNDNVISLAAGAGGSGGTGGLAGGAGGGLTGGDGQTHSSYPNGHGKGGTQSAGGVGGTECYNNGLPGTLGYDKGGILKVYPYGPTLSGGGGYYSGGSGGRVTYPDIWLASGGGAGYIGGANITDAATSFYATNVYHNGIGGTPTNIGLGVAVFYNVFVDDVTTYLNS